MTNSTELVQRAARLLDSMVGRHEALVPNWRSKIDTESLHMGSCRSCILGQIFGDYGDGTKFLDNNNSAEWQETEEAFCAYKDEWLVELAIPRVSEEITWARAGREISDVQNVTLGGKPHVAYINIHGDACVTSFKGFVDYFRPVPPPEYKRGDVLKSGLGNYYLYLSGDHVIQLQTMTRQTLKYFTEDMDVKLTKDNTKTGSALWGNLFDAV